MGSTQIGNSTHVEILTWAEILMKCKSSSTRGMFESRIEYEQRRPNLFPVTFKFVIKASILFLLSAIAFISCDLISSYVEISCKKQGKMSNAVKFNMGWGELNIRMKNLNRVGMKNLNRVRFFKVTP